MFNMMMILPAGEYQSKSQLQLFWEHCTHGQIDVDPLVFCRPSGLVHCHLVLFHDLALGGVDFW